MNLIGKRQGGLDIVGYVCMYVCPAKEFGLYLDGSEKPLN